MKVPAEISIFFVGKPRYKKRSSESISAHVVGKSGWKTGSTCGSYK